MKTEENNVFEVYSSGDCFWLFSFFRREGTSLLCEAQ
jgi:hypothetical protein